MEQHRQQISRESVENTIEYDTYNTDCFKVIGNTIEYETYIYTSVLKVIHQGDI